jgi:hypothetical protein
MAETNLKIRSDKFSSVKFTAPTGGVVAGAMRAQGSIIGVVAESKDAAAEAVLIYRCEKIVVPKVAATGVTFTVGAKVYFKSASAAVTNASTGNTLCGRALEAAAADDDEVLIDLEGSVVA